jgi:cystathionine gamma-lyase
LADQAIAEKWLGVVRLVQPAPTFAAVHSTAERRVRCGGDDVHHGFIRRNVGIEDSEDLRSDILQGLRLRSLINAITSGPRAVVTSRN